MDQKTEKKIRRQVFFWLLALGAFLFFLWMFAGILLPFVAGMALAYFLDPVADLLERWGLSRLMATVIILFFFVVIFIVTLMILVPDRRIPRTDAGPCNPPAIPACLFRKPVDQEDHRH